jgi:hypothetical protein
MNTLHWQIHVALKIYTVSKLVITEIQRNKLQAKLADPDLGSLAMLLLYIMKTIIQISVYILSNAYPAITANDRTLH